MSKAGWLWTKWSGWVVGMERAWSFFRPGMVDFSLHSVQRDKFMYIQKVKVKAVCGSYSTAALRHIVHLPE